MTVQPPTRRSVVVGGLLGAATLSGCSVTDLTTRKVVDPEAADRARITRAIALSWELKRSITATAATDASTLAAFRAFASLHDAQISAFARAAGVRSTQPTLPASTQRPLTRDDLRQREAALARSFRRLALPAVRGDVAALLASAAAGIDQALAR